MSKLIARVHPLVLFLCVGALLFVLDEYGKSEASEDKLIKVSSGKVEQLERTLMQRHGQPPTPEQLDAELQAYIDEELLYREALNLRLHENDEVVRRRLAQTMAFIIEGKADLENPGDSELQAWYQQSQEGMQAVTRIDFRHIFFSSDRHQGQASAAAASALDQVSSGSVSPTEIGDPFLLGQRFNAQTPAMLARTFGRDFADVIAAAIVEAGPGEWVGPVSSKYGEHLVLVEGRAPAKVLGFEQQRDQLVNAWRIQRRREVREQALSKLRQEFTIEVEARPAQQVGAL